MTEMKIESGVPIPPNPRRCERYPWRDMGHGDSLFVPLPDGVPLRRHRQSVANSGRAWLQNNRPGWTYTSRSSHDPPGVRVWFLREEPADD